MLIRAGRNLSFKSERTALVCNQEVSSPGCIFIPASSELWQLTWLVSAILVERSIKVTGHHSLCSSWAMMERKNKPGGWGDKPGVVGGECSNVLLPLLRSVRERGHSVLVYSGLCWWSSCLFYLHIHLIFCFYFPFDCDFSSCPSVRTLSSTMQLSGYFHFHSAPAPHG